MDTFIFIYGFIATAIVGCSIGMLIWAAVEDGKADKAAQQQIQDYQAATTEGNFDSSS